MRRGPVGWDRALRALLVAGALLLAVAFVAGNFVVVDVRVLWLGFETRVAWLAVVPAALGFAAGVLWNASRPRG